MEVVIDVRDVFLLFVLAIVLCLLKGQPKRVVCCPPLAQLLAFSLLARTMMNLCLFLQWIMSLWTKNDYSSLYELLVIR